VQIQTPQQRTWPGPIELLCWKQGSRRGGTNLGEVDLSLHSGTDAEENNGEDSDASENNTKALRDDLERRNQVTPPSSPLQNKYLTGLMKSPEKRLADAQAKQALDEDPIYSLSSSQNQVRSSLSALKAKSRAGDVTEHGGSMSAQHGSPSLNLLDIALLANLQSAADVIRNGFSLSLSQVTEAKGINFNAPSQVDCPSGTLMSDKPRDRQRNMKEALVLFQKNGSKTPLPPLLQRYKDQQDGKKEESKLPADSGGKDIGQRVLSESFCYNRLAEIRVSTVPVPYHVFI
jgi:hypothetical protein